MSTAVAHFHCLHSLPTPSSCLQVYPVATAKFMVAFTQIRRVSTSLTLGGGGKGGGGKRHDFVGDAVICARYRRGL